MYDPSDTILALDIGDKRIGVASCTVLSRLPSPLTTIEVTDHIMMELKKLIIKSEASAVVIGMPKDINAKVTAQTRKVEKFVEDLKARLKTIPIFLQDEAVTSIKAEKELNERGRPYQKADIDALAAVYILEDFINEHPEIFSK